jgi:putative protease
MPKLADYLALRIDSLKIEGRNKSEYYVAVVTRAYRAAIDAYRADPQAFDPAPFLAELEAVRSRGYTLGFHQGRPGQFSENRNYGQSASVFEYAGLVRGWRQGELLVEVKNRLQSGDVLEFALPGKIRNVRLRVYDFLLEGSQASVERVSAGEGRAIRIPKQAFHAESIDEGDLPQGSVVRKTTVLDDEARAVVAHNRETYLAEQGLISSASLSVPRSTAKSTRPPRLGAEGCCGLGCNGCLPFWHEPRYERARATLSARFDGERLTAPVSPAGLSSLD